MATIETRQEGSPRRPRAAVLGALVALAIVVLVFVAGGDDESDAGKVGVAREVSAKQLQEFARERGNPVFWAGEIEGTKLEFTEATRGHVFVRYLPEIAPIGDSKPQYTTIATYPQPDALSVVRKAGRRRGNVTRELSEGGLATWSRSRANSVYLAVPGIDFLVEVFHPQAKTAQNLARSGRVKPVL